MYVLGHVVTSAGARGTDVDLLAGERVLELMLPDLLSCHDWAYDRSWYRSETRRDRLVVAHMVGDAVVHYGVRWDGLHRRAGWAYRRMGVVTRRYSAFWREAADRGWRRPDALDRDSRRGWAHTLVEYSVDQLLADDGDWGDLLDAVRAEARQTLQDRTWVDEYVLAAAVAPSKPLASQPARYCGALARAERPDEMHLRGLAVKFGLVETDEVLDWLRGWTRDIVRTVGAEEIRSVVDGVSEVLTDLPAHGYPDSVADAVRLPDPSRTLSPDGGTRRPPQDRSTGR